MNQELKVHGIGKIINVGKNELEEHDFAGSYEEPYMSKIPAELFVYSYTSGSYEGNGTAVWKNGDDWGYQYLGHCSCNGPLEDIKTSFMAKFTLDQIKEILKEDNTEESLQVLDYLNTL